MWDGISILEFNKHMSAEKRMIQYESSVGCQLIRCLNSEKNQGRKFLCKYRSTWLATLSQHCYAVLINLTDKFL